MLDVELCNSKFVVMASRALSHDRENRDDKPTSATTKLWKLPQYCIRSDPKSLPLIENKFSDCHLST